MHLVAIMMKKAVIKMHICRILMLVAIYEISVGRFKFNSESADSQNYKGNIVKQQFSLSTKQFLVAPKKKKNQSLLNMQP